MDFRNKVTGSVTIISRDELIKAGERGIGDRNSNKREISVTLRFDIISDWEESEIINRCLHDWRRNIGMIKSPFMLL